MALSSISAAIDGRRLIRLGALLWAASALVGCRSTQHGLRIERLAEDVELVRLTENLWVHVSDDPRERWGLVPANGLLVLGEEDSLLVDTGWNAEETRRIVAFADELGRPVRQVVVTHAHSDRVGGVAALDSASITIYAQELTAPILSARGASFRVVPYVEELSLHVGRTSVEVYYPGPGHSRDNAVVYLPAARVLFAGCVVRSAGSADLGNREAAVLAAWPMALLKLLERYPVVDLVIPGHGPPGGLNLIQHTLGLLEQELSVVTPN